MRKNSSFYIAKKKKKKRKLIQSRRRQSADGQAQLDVGGEGANNSCAKRAAEFWTYLFLAVLSLEFSFKLGVTIQLQITLLSSTGPQQIKATLNCHTNSGLYHVAG